MALVKCIGCGHLVSTKAKKCPKCGMPVQGEERAVILPKQSGTDTTPQKTITSIETKDAAQVEIATKKEENVEKPQQSTGWIVPLVFGLILVVCIILAVIFASHGNVTHQGIEATGMQKIDEEMENLQVVSMNINGHEYVDLGLSVKWATCNMGASSPEEYGDYYAWGETETKSTYDWSTYKWCKGSYDTQTKYCTSSGYGTVDNKTVLDPEDDVAYVKWGGSWRMPTEAEMTELRKKCTWIWTTQGGMNGYKVIGPSRNSIFLPAAGYCHCGDVRGQGDDGDYWSSTPNGSLSAYILLFSSGYQYVYYDYRYYGYSVRAVLAE